MFAVKKLSVKMFRNKIDLILASEKSVFSLNWSSFFSSQWGKVSSEGNSPLPILGTSLYHTVFNCVS